MSAYEIEYVDGRGYNHAEVVDGYDQEDAVHRFRAQHSGEGVVLQDVILLGNAEELEVAA